MTLAQAARSDEDVPLQLHCKVHDDNPLSGCRSTQTFLSIYIKKVEVSEFVREAGDIDWKKLRDS